MTPKEGEIRFHFVTKGLKAACQGHGKVSRLELGGGCTGAHMGSRSCHCRCLNATQETCLGSCRTARITHGTLSRAPAEAALLGELQSPVKTTDSGVSPPAASWSGDLE